MDDQLTIAIRLIVAACALIPFVVFLVSYLRTRMIRLLFAALGFGVYVVKEVLLVYRPSFLDKLVDNAIALYMER